MTTILKKSSIPQFGPNLEFTGITEEVFHDNVPLIAGN
jgi:hypothetical protein